MLEQLEELKEQKTAMEREAENIEKEQQKAPNLKDKVIENTKWEIDEIDRAIDKTETKRQETLEEFKGVEEILFMISRLFENVSDVPGTEESYKPKSLFFDDHGNLHLDGGNIEQFLGVIEKKTNLVMKMVKEAGLEEILIEQPEKKKSPVKLLKRDKRVKHPGDEMRKLHDFLSKNYKVQKEKWGKCLKEKEKSCWLVRKWIIMLII